MANRRVSVQDIKQALLDPRFREALPEELSEDVKKFLGNPGCGCNHPIYIRVMQKAARQVAQYYPNKEADPEEVEKESARLAKNEWVVINCSIHELSDELKKLGSGRIQLDVARYQDQVTVVANRLEAIF